MFSWNQAVVTQLQAYLELIKKICPSKVLKMVYLICNLCFR